MMVPTPFMTRATTSRVRRLALTALAVAVGACSEARTAPTRYAPVRLETSTTVEGTASSIAAQISYRHTGDTTSIVLGKQTVDLTAQTSALELQIDIAPCLNDAAREKPTDGSDPKTTCILYLQLTLLDQSGNVMDSYTTGAITATPGLIAQAPAAVLGDSVTSLRITNRADTLRSLGSTRQLTATVLGRGGKVLTDVTPTWSSLDPRIVTVDSTGFAQAITAGTARVVAMARNQADTVPLVVKQIVANGTASLRDPTLSIGDTTSFVITAQDSSGNNIPASTFTPRYYSADTSVATVDSITGLVTATGIGTASVRAQFRVVHLDVSLTVGGPRSPVQLALGAFHTCRLDTGTHLTQCWGADNYGQLAAGGGSRFGAPDTLWGGDRYSSMAASATDGMQTCGVDVSAHAVCWGFGGFGAVYDGSLLVRMIPTVVGPAHTFTSVVTGSQSSDHSQWACGIGTDTHAYCWGDNPNGQLGDGTVAAHHDPAPVSGGASYTQLATGDGFTCGITTVGTVNCWGAGSHGQIGNGSTGDALVPTAVSLPTTVRLSAGGYVACALDASNNGRCWGDDSYAQMGNGAASGVHATPVAAFGGTTFTRISIGARHACGTTTGAATECWGDNSAGQLGDGSQVSHASPTLVSSGVTFANVFAGATHTCALTSGFALYCWGNNGYRQLGDGTQTARLTPVAVQGGHSFIAATLSPTGTCAVDNASVGYCWGNGYNGVARSIRTTAVSSFTSQALTQVASGIQFSCGLDGSGTAWCAGDNTLGTLGDGTGLVNARPIQINGSFTFADLAIASNSACGVTPAGTGLCWGDNTFAQLGDGTTSARTSPTTVWGGISFRHVVASLTSSCGLSTDGRVYCWGFNNDGQLGDGTTNPNPLPTPVAGNLRFGSVSVGPLFACGLANGGVAYCWGNNSHGQLGDGTTTDRHVPTAVATSLRFVALDTRGAHVCGITQSGAAYCWGDNYAGQLGDGTTTDRTTPTLVAGALNFVAIATGALHSCGVTTQGTTFCWGWNVAGQLGNGTLNDSATPIQAP